MCGFLYANFTPENISLQDISPRGPDGNNTIVNDLGYFYHSRLATRETNIPQPAVNGFGTLLYNGTEYCLDTNDVDFILSNLNDDVNNNIEFLKTLSGDFAICWVTEKNILLATDCFNTKPLFWSCENKKFICGSTFNSLRSCNFAAYKLPANTIMVFDKETLNLKYKKEIYIWNLKQGSASLHNVFDAFEESVMNKYDSNCLVNISSGYDSGAIACCLYKNNKNYTSLSYIETENKKTINARLEKTSGKKILITNKNFLKNVDTKQNILWNDFLEKDPIIYDISLISAQVANKYNIKTMLIGTGGD